METRAQRRLAQQQSQQYQQQQRPSYPQLQTMQSTPISPSTSAFQSSSSLASVGSINTNQQHQQQYLQPQQGFGAASAPLPSPSTAQHSGSGYFNPTSHPAQQARIPQQMQAGGFVGQRGGGNGAAPETAPFLQDFNLVAEAAKRAQMACLARDLGDVGL